MNKRFTIFILLMALFVPWAAKAQETKTIQVAPDRGGDRGTMTVYKRVSSLNSGRNYLIVNSATANSDALALSQVSSTASTITASYVHINSGISGTGNAIYIADLADATALWRATSSDDGWTFSHSKNGSTYYIYTSSTYSDAGSLSANTSATEWTWGSNQLSYTATTWLIFSSTYYITPSSTGFSIGSDEANVYLFEETNVTAYDVTASVSPSGIGRVTGAGQYPAGATCTLTASTFNSEYTFNSWTVNGSVVSTSPTYSFTVNADQNVVANFESTVPCPAPVNLTAGSIYGHSIQLDWTSEADNFNVRYRTIGSGETQVFFDGFENGLGNWTTIRNGGGTTSTDWLQGPDRENLYAHTGSYVAESRSWNSTAYSVDNWLITPQVTLDGTLKYWVYGNGSYPDHYDVYISTTGNSISDFSLFYEPASVTSTWTEVTVDLSSFNSIRGYIALRHTDTDKEYLMIDDFGIYSERYGEWSQLIPASDTPFTLTGLESQTNYQVQVQANCGDELSGWSSRLNFTTPAPSTAAPTNLTVDVNSISSDRATVSWQGVAANDSHQYYEVYYAESNVTSVPDSPAAPNLIDSITETSYTILGLTPETEYHVWVRDYCGEDGYSAWTPYQTFTTLESCPAPTGVTITNETGHGATIEWNGTSDSYLVMVGEAEQNITYSYDFEDGTQGWTVLKGNTGDSPNNWHHNSTHVSYDGSSGNLQDWSSFGHNSSSGFMISESYISATSSGGTAYGAVTPDNYLVSPQVRLGGSISFYAGARNTSYCAEKFSVMVSTTDNTNTESFTTIETWILSLSEVGFNPTPYTVDLSAYAGQTGYIAIRHWDCYDQWVLCIDDVTIESGSTATTWMTYEAEESPFTLYDATNIRPETTYSVQVIGICDDEESHPSAATSFTTTIACPAPTDLAVVENSISGHGATVTWNGTSEGYNMYLGTEGEPTNLLSVDFTNGIPNNWSNTSDYPWSIVDGHMQSSNAGVASSTSTISVTVTFPANGTVEFDAQCRGEGTSYDVCQFLIDSDTKFTKGANGEQWDHYTYDVTAGEHTFIWSYTKDSSVDPTGDYFAVDNVVMVTPSIVWDDPFYVEGTEYTFSGLSAETTYFVKVQSNCGEDGLSTESNSVTFTTEVACIPPTNLHVTDVTAHEAVLNWDGDAESYNVNYYKAFFFESFEEDLSQWTIYKNGDENSTEWGIENPQDNSSDLSAHSGYFAAVAYSDYDVHADSWLISPQIQFPNQTTLKFWIMRSTYDDALDEYEVRLSTTDTDTASFNIVLKGKTVANSTWTEVSIPLDDYDGQLCYIAIRHDYTDGFFIMVDDFGIFGWSEDIVATDNSLLIDDLLPETEYQWQVQANCGDEDGLSQWSDISTFTTLKACPIPFNLSASDETAYGATISWTGYNDSYNVWVGQFETTTTNYDIEGQTIPTNWTNNSTYPWTIVSGGQNGSYCIQSGNAGQASTTSSISFTLTLPTDGTIEFDAECMGEGTSTFFDHCDFSIDGTRLLYVGANITGWNHYSYEVAAGEHTFTWSYTKDSSVNPTGDYFAVDNITIESKTLLSEMNYATTESPFILNDATNILPNTTYSVKVKGICDGEETDYSTSTSFTTLDESTKVFVTEGDWNNEHNWIPAGVPTIEENAILRAEATVFDVAEANIITIENDATLTIEDGGQLKTNADVEATMKRFIIGYGTDYVETNNGYYLIALPTVAPISAAEVGLITDESDYDLYSWDRTATDEEWQNNHDSINLENGQGYLYANRDDMEMNFTATLRNSSEPIVVTPSYDEVEHGGWSLFGNPFPCEAYITTDAEGMAFYRLVGNELVPITGTIAPLEAFFVKATAAGQTFTISREVPEESKSHTNGNTNRFKVKFVTK